ncbi:MAG: hypothetical protein RJA99_2036 [Pseudomonadota bacterium]|jgi:hypothetical protein
MNVESPRFEVGPTAPLRAPSPVCVLAPRPARRVRGKVGRVAA